MATMSEIDVGTMHSNAIDGGRIEWRVSPGLTPYDVALAEMEARAAAVLAGEARELIWLLEHPPVYTAGTSAAPGDLIDARFPVGATGRAIAPECGRKRCARKGD
jgi:lipoyl(octanoyl) transferase